MVPASLLALLALLGIGLLVVLAIHEEIDQRKRLNTLEEHNELLRQLFSELYAAQDVPGEDRAFEKFLAIQPRAKRKG
jgi:hypothetical protein